jgi:hypothetical protein
VELSSEEEENRGTTTALIARANGFIQLASVSEQVKVGVVSSEDSEERTAANRRKGRINDKAAPTQRKKAPVANSDGESDEVVEWQQQKGAAAVSSDEEGPPPQPKKAKLAICSESGEERKARRKENDAPVDWRAVPSTKAEDYSDVPLQKKPEAVGRKVGDIDSPPRTTPSSPLRQSRARQQQGAAWE